MHSRLIVYISGALQSALPADLRARSEEKVLLEVEADSPPQRYGADVAVVESPPAVQTRTVPGASAAATIPPLEGDDRHGRTIS